MKAIKLIMCVGILLIASQVDAQILKKLGKKAERSAERTVERRVDYETHKSTDRALDSVIDAPKKDRRKRKTTKSRNIIGAETEEKSDSINPFYPQEHLI